LHNLHIFGGIGHFAAMRENIGIAVRMLLL